MTAKLVGDGALADRHAASLVRLAIDRVPTIWGEGHVRLGTLWDYYAQYPYMPRLRDRSVLAAGVVDQPMVWEVNGFALAHGHDGERYQGLWLPEDDGPTPPVSDETLLVQPRVARAQREQEAPEPTPGPDPAPTPGPTPPGLSPEPGPTPSPHPVLTGPTRYYGVAPAGPGRLALDAKQVLDEIIQPLLAAGGAVTVRIEVEASHDEGFDERAVRTVSENATVLKFEQSSFED